MEFPPRKCRISGLERRQKLNVNRAFAGQLQVLQCELQENWVLAIYRKVQT